VSNQEVTAVAQRILQELQKYVPPTLLPAFQYCLDHLPNPFTVEQAAEACGIKRRALEYRFRKSRLPPPGRCLALCRLLLAVHQLEHGTDSVEHVASTHGFGTAAALRKSLTRHLGAAPHDLRTDGTFEAALAAFLEGFPRRGRIR